MAMHRRHRKTLPGLWLMTDERVADDRLLAAARALPRGRAGIILRHYRTSPAQRRALFDALRAIARRRRLLLLLAGPAQVAAAWHADGWHGRAARRAGRPLLHSAPAHDRREMQAAQRAGADLLFLSPLFPTRSHPGAPALGRARFAALARGARPPVIALGGMRAEQARGLALLGASGWAAIDGLTRN
ncbi:thiamine phosphate synthase [Sphingobium naphthae]|uniref:Thiamine phosphate synthase n=1 Tax=Sphingobium naphthae TaxID=1886786 RepID=A0ABU3ZYL8_9SPHN|nr:thiamine phosphate synthase [Sphingobium naphthae]MDV5824623.1 thiamine phosphate synthase [Sphingobium naphthae]